MTAAGYRNPLLHDGADWICGREQNPADLNELVLNDDAKGGVPIASLRGSARSGSVEAIFTGLIPRLCAEIRKWPAVVGCMAWLTNRRVLETLAGRDAVSILLQKEDFLRPDSHGWTKERLRELYDALPAGARWEFGVGHYNSSSADELPPLMCCGVAKRDATPPRMHHKFLVFGDWRLERYEELPEVEPWRVFVPKVVWTGSLNATENGARSLENAVIIRDPVIAQAYHGEWATLLGLAEPLNWAAEWVAPVYRIGT